MIPNTEYVNVIFINSCSARIHSIPNILLVIAMCVLVRFASITHYPMSINHYVCLNRTNLLILPRFTGNIWKFKTMLKVKHNIFVLYKVLANYSNMSKTTYNWRN